MNWSCCGDVETKPGVGRPANCSYNNMQLISQFIQWYIIGLLRSAKKQQQQQHSIFYLALMSFLCISFAVGRSIYVQSLGGIRGIRSWLGCCWLLLLINISTGDHDWPKTYHNIFKLKLRGAWTYWIRKQGVVISPDGNKQTKPWA